MLQRLPGEIHAVVVDLPGHGNTTMPGTTDDISAERFSECVKEVHIFKHITDRKLYMIGKEVWSYTTGDDFLNPTSFIHQIKSLYFLFSK